MKISFLTDNYVDSAHLKAEHGFSCLIEYNDKFILFDTGQTDTSIYNLNRIYNKIPNIDTVILSHGHYDHTGGLNKLSEILNHNIKVYAHKHIFDKHLKKNLDTFNYIGIENNLNKNLKFIFNEELTEIFEDIYLSGNIKIYEKFDADANLFAKIEGNYIKDPFRDEQYLIIKDADELVIITGCSHAGIINIIKHTKELFKNNKIKAIIGGFHLFRSSESQLNEVINYLKESKIDKIITGHCTGLNGLFKLKEQFGNSLIPIKVGLKLEI